MNVLEFGDDWFLNRAFDADRRMRLLYWMSLARLVVFIAAVGSIFGALMISLIFDVDEQPWMVIPEVGLGIVSILLAICYAVLDGNVLMLKVVDRMQNQLDRVPAKSDATI